MLWGLGEAGHWWVYMNVAVDTESSVCALGFSLNIFQDREIVSGKGRCDQVPS